MHGQGTVTVRRSLTQLLAFTLTSTTTPRHCGCSRVFVKALLLARNPEEWMGPKLLSVSELEVNMKRNIPEMNHS